MYILVHLLMYCIYIIIQLFVYAHKANGIEYLMLEASKQLALIPQFDARNFFCERGRMVLGRKILGRLCDTTWVANNPLVGLLA